MKTEYILSANAKAELRKIDDEIAMLCKRKAEIYMDAPVRYILDDIEMKDYVKCNPETAYSLLLADQPLLPKHVIRKLIFGEE